VTCTRKLSLSAINRPPLVRTHMLFKMIFPDVSAKLSGVNARRTFAELGFTPV